RSVEYKRGGCKVKPDGRHITFTDGCGIGRLRLLGNANRHIEEFPTRQIKRVRLIRRADDYYLQAMVEAERHCKPIPIAKQVDIDQELKGFLTDSAGHTVANPDHVRKAQKRLKMLHRRLSRRQQKSANRKKARKHLAKVYLKVQRQREDFACKTASTLITSGGLIASEHLQIRNLVKNRKLAKSISDATWGRCLTWLNDYGQVCHLPVMAVEPAFTSQQWSSCGTRINKSLFVRTPHLLWLWAGAWLDRDHNTALNILARALEGYRTAGYAGTGPIKGQNASGQTASPLPPARAQGRQAS
ncbi:RNA-guided endonuclease InsQ/TnpB family protein, partial [Thermogemmatispora sp.]|uniref:RNA-guided endonuclease InsQ/TnpB family protein n=1 Tax=Thermogemmatispora sp. TaxID=1968838 RepID=UPI0035E3F61F